MICSNIKCTIFGILNYLHYTSIFIYEPLKKIFKCNLNQIYNLCPTTFFVTITVLTTK